MSIPISRTKVVLPRRRTDLLSRPRLLKYFEDLLEYKLFIVAAPAGYGKTSLLVDYAHQSKLPICWLTLDTLDRDPQRFAAHFIAALAQRFPSCGRQSQAALDAGSSAPFRLERLTTTLINDVYENVHEHFLLILDDYHLVNDSKEIEGFISRFVQEVDENCHLILSSRTLTALPDMPLLVARSQVFGLSFDELAFQRDEIISLVEQNFHVHMPEAAAEELAQETEGWITGLLLSAQMMWEGMADRLRVARISGVGLYDYLAQQVLDQQPQGLRSFLLRTSILEEFDARLCSAVLGESQAWPAWIDSLLQNNLFVLPVGEDGKSIRYHHLFRDFLQSQLEKEDPQEKDSLLRKLVSVYSIRGEWEKAYAASQRVGDPFLVAELVERAGSNLVKTGRMAMLAEWIDSLPGEVSLSRPNLLSLRGVAAIVQGQVEQGLELLNQSAEALRSPSDAPRLALTLVRRATAYRFLGRYQDSIRDAREALSLVQSKNLAENRVHPVEAEALRTIGMGLFQIGQLKEAIEQFDQSLAAYRQLDDRQNEAMVRMELGLVSMSAGSYQQALSYYEQALAYWRETKNAVGQANLLNNLGVLYQLMGNYPRAVSTFEEALVLARQNGYVRMQAYVLCGIGDLYTDLDISEAALQAYRLARQVARRIDYRFLLLYTDLSEADQCRRSGEYERAQSLLDSAGRMAQQSGSTYEQGLWRLAAGRLCLSDRDRLFEAGEHLQAAAGYFEEDGQWVEAARANLYLSAAAYWNGEFEKSLAAFDRSIHIASRLESQHVLVIAGLELKELLKEALATTDAELLTVVPALRSAALRLRSVAVGLLEQIERFERRVPALRRALRPQAKAIPMGPPKLTIHALGRAQVELDGKLVTAPEWQNQKRVREFFFYLLAHPDGLTKEEIGLIFWPDSSPAQLKLQFKNAIYRLRFALGQNVVSFNEDRYWFNRDLDYEYDVETFLACLKHGRETESADEKASAFQALADLYRGPYLPEMSGTWVWPERERLRQTYEAVILELAQLHLQARRYDLTLSCCHKILEEDPCLEEAHRLAMKAYAKAGNRAAVKRQYERCCQALREEVNLPPSSLTTQTYYEALNYG